MFTLFFFKNCNHRNVFIFVFMYVLDAQSFLDKVFFESDSRPWRQSTHGQQIHLLGDDQEEQLKALTKITRETFISGGDGRLFTSIFLVCSIKKKKKTFGIYLLDFGLLQKITL